MYDTEDQYYCYKKTNILKNKYDIKSLELLEVVEREVTDVNAIILEKHILERTLHKVIDKPLGLDLLLKIHDYLFNDIYDFAGELRQVRLVKGNTTFCYPQHIEHELFKLFHDLKNDKYLKDIDKNQFAEKLAYYITELNMIHPFREGNGRVIRIFSNIIAVNNGYYLNYKTIQDQYLDVMIKSVIDYSYLTALLNKCLIKL